MRLTKTLLALALLAAGLVAPLTASALCSGASSSYNPGCSTAPPPKCHK
jgi:hypothetical protein